MLEAAPIATAGIAAMITMNRIARSVRPNHRIASGSHEIDGNAWSPAMGLPMLRCTNSDAAMASPTRVPTTIPIDRPTTRRIKLACVASRIDSRGGSGCAKLSAKSRRTSPGNGSTLWLNTPDAAVAHHRRSRKPTARSRGAS